VLTVYRVVGLEHPVVAAVKELLHLACDVPWRDVIPQQAYLT
jgi:hypothetical protein